jgi:hypothetical protein
MQLDSVRELKDVIRRKAMELIARAAGIGRDISLPAQPLREIETTQRTVAIGIAPRTARDFRLAVRIQRRGLEDSPQLDRIRTMAKGEVDVRYIGRLVKHAPPWHQRRNRPLRIGGSVGHFAITAGTLGGFVTRRRDGAILMLSNNHVLANENRAETGDAILQPGRFDGGRRPVDRVGDLAAFVRLRQARVNLVDAAVADVRKGIAYDAARLTGIGRLAGLGPAVLDDSARVAKVGRTTGVTRGRVTAFELDNVVVAYDSGNLRFDDQIEIEGAGDKAFSDGGDSGSLIVDADRLAVALLFAGGDQGGGNGRGLTYANPLTTVLERLKVDLLF